MAADREGIIRFWNPGAKRLFGHSSDEALGQSLDLIIPERLRQQHWDGFSQVMQTGQSRYGESDVLSVPARLEGGTTPSHLSRKLSRRRRIIVPRIESRSSGSMFSRAATAARLR